METKISNSRKGRIVLMILAFVLVVIQWWLIAGMFDYMKLGTMIPNLLDKFFGRYLVNWFVWLLYGAFIVLIPLYFRIRGKTTLKSKVALGLAIAANIASIIFWSHQGDLAQFSTAIMIIIMTSFVNTILAGVLYVLLIYKYFPD